MELCALIDPIPCLDYYWYAQFQARCHNTLTPNDVTQSDLLCLFVISIFICLCSVSISQFAFGNAVIIHQAATNEFSGVGYLVATTNHVNLKIYLLYLFCFTQMSRKPFIMCNVANCGETEHLMKFPNNQNTQHKWTAWIRQHQPGFRLDKYSRICYRHFDRDDIQNFEEYRRGFQKS